MNIFGRVFGGFLVLISLGWLATIVGIRPGTNTSNQINSTPTANNLTAPAKLTTGATPATTSKAQTSTFNAGNTGAAGTPKTEVEKNPRNATTPDKSGSLTAPASPSPAAAVPAAAPAAAPPVAAGW